MFWSWDSFSVSAVDKVHTTLRGYTAGSSIAKNNSLIKGIDTLGYIKYLISSVGWGAFSYIVAIICIPAILYCMFT